jgi:hypothetical protein
VTYLNLSRQIIYWLGCQSAIRFAVRMSVAYNQETHDITQTYGIRNCYGRLIYSGVARPKKAYTLCAKAAMARYTSKITEEDQAGRPIRLGLHCTG